MDPGRRHTALGNRHIFYTYKPHAGYGPGQTPGCATNKNKMHRTWSFHLYYYYMYIISCVRRRAPGRRPKRADRLIIIINGSLVRIILYRPIGLRHITRARACVNEPNGLTQSIVTIYTSYTYTRYTRRTYKLGYLCEVCTSLYFLCIYLIII